ncbi:MAG: hypothetical protein Q8K60_04585 [Parachlamydiaceae bacterium]|nr:hypothetical protein [Parachlamydiaceae bacterium]
MLNKILNFIHHFDEKMHYSIYYSLLKVKNEDGIFIEDAVHQKKCPYQTGRWNFMIANKDYSCGIYKVLETIRQKFFSSIETNKKNIELILCLHKHNSDEVYSLNDKENSKNKEICKCDNKISKKIFFKVIKPVLDEMLKNTQYQIKTKIVKES